MDALLDPSAIGAVSIYTIEAGGVDDVGSAGEAIMSPGSVRSLIPGKRRRMWRSASFFSSLISGSRRRLVRLVRLVAACCLGRPLGVQRAP